MPSPALIAQKEVLGLHGVARRDRRFGLLAGENGRVNVPLVRNPERVEQRAKLGGRHHEGTAATAWVDRGIPNATASEIAESDDTNPTTPVHPHRSQNRPPPDPTMLEP